MTYVSQALFASCLFVKCIILKRSIQLFMAANIQLNPLGTKWLIELALISSFCCDKRMIVFEFLLEGTLIHRKLAPSRRLYSFTYPGRIESYFSVRGNKVAQKFKSWQSRDRTGDLVVGKQRSYQLRQHSHILLFQIVQGVLLTKQESVALS